MRKPLLLVCLLTCAALITGGVSATTASAGTGTAQDRAAPARPGHRDVSTVDLGRPGATGRVQQQVLDLVNRNRRRSGCGPLVLDRRLGLAAQAHAADMARQRYFAHDSRNGEDAGQRVRDEGYSWQRYGENIARGPGSSSAVVNGWMRSPGHRRNILDCRLREMGLGLAYDRRHRPYWVQDFATPR
jgi:uncharacterized protein YkwD